MTSGTGDVHSYISGGRQDVVITGRDFHAPITITTGAAKVPAYLQHPERWPCAARWEALAAGAHRARPGEDGGAVPVYVPRDVDQVLRRQLAAAAEEGGMVLVVGDSTAGKTRAAFEAVRDVLPEHRVLSPLRGSDLPAALEVVVGLQVRCVIWLDDLENYLGLDGLEPGLLAELVRLRIPVMATMRLQQYQAFRPYGGSDGLTDVAAQQMAAIGARVLNQVEPVELNRLWSPTELERAAQCSDERITEALVHHESYGVAEYLAAGPALWREWRHASRVGGNPRGAALVAAAVDLSRTGLRPPYSLHLLSELHEGHLADAGGPLLRPEDHSQALTWAARVRFGVTSLLLPSTEPDFWSVFDYLVDQTHTPIGEQTWQAALDTADDTDRYTVGMHAYRSGVTQVAELAWRPLADAGVTRAAFSLGHMLSQSERVTEAEAWLRRAVAGETPMRRTTSASCSIAWVASRKPKRRSGSP